MGFLAKRKKKGLILFYIYDNRKIEENLISKLLEILPKAVLTRTYKGSIEITKGYRQLKFVTLFSFARFLQGFFMNFNI